MNRHRTLLVWLAAMAITLLDSSVRAESATTVFLNGVPTPVYFNDGDSFRVLAGPLFGSKARLAGYNTLESHGPVHRWGDWHPKELYAVAKKATRHARTGVWHCESKDMAKDTYGRILWHCFDLALSQIQHGYALALSVDERPADSRLLAAQRHAIVHRRGLWAKGVPTFVLTSVHSADEPWDPAGDRKTDEPVGRRHYNRLVSTVDGHSVKWFHQKALGECEEVCHEGTELSREEALGVVSLLRRDANSARVIRGIPDIIVALAVNTFLQTGAVPAFVPSQGRATLRSRLRAMRADGLLPKPSVRRGSCMTYVVFERWYSDPRPLCLR